MGEEVVGQVRVPPSGRDRWNLLLRSAQHRRGTVRRIQHGKIREDLAGARCRVEGPLRRIDGMGDEKARTRHRRVAQGRNLRTPQHTPHDMECIYVRYNTAKVPNIEQQQQSKMEKMTYLQRKSFPFPSTHYAFLSTPHHPHPI